MDKKVIIITGSSRGIGYHTACVLHSQGHSVYATMRNVSDSKLPEGISVLPLDVTDSDSIQQAVQRVIEEQGRIDVLINNAGYGIFSPVDLASDCEVHNQFDVNVYGVLRTIRVSFESPDQSTF